MPPDTTVILNPSVWEQYLALAEKYGVSLVLLILAIIAGYFAVRWLAKSFDDMSKRQEMMMDKLFAQVTEIKAIVPDPAQESVEKVTRLNKAIKGLMREVMLDFHPDWCHFWQFHNGTRLVGKSRTPFMYISLTHELVMEGAISVQDEFVSVLLSKVDGMIFILIDNPLLIEKADENGYADNPITGRMYQLGAKVQDIMPVKDAGAEIVGVLELCWKIPPNLSTVRKNNLSDYAHRLGVILSTYDASEM